MTIKQSFSIPRLRRTAVMALCAISAVACAYGAITAIDRADTVGVVVLSVMAIANIVCFSIGALQQMNNVRCGGLNPATPNGTGGSAHE